MKGKSLPPRPPVAVRLFDRLLELVLPKGSWTEHAETVEVFSDLYVRTPRRKKPAMLFRELRGLARLFSARLTFQREANRHMPKHPPFFNRFSDTFAGIQHAIRGLANNPGYTFAFVLTLGLGIGANTAIFSIVNGVLLQPLPYPDADRIMYMKQPARLAGTENSLFSFPELAEYRAESRTISEFVEFGDWTFTVVGHGDPHRATGGLVSANYFDVLGIRPQLGRTLTIEDEDRAATPIAVLTHEYWVRVFGSDPDAIGTSFELNSKPVTIVGVLEPGSHYAGRRKQDFYVNYASNDHYVGASMQDDRTHRMTDAFALLAPGATLEQARTELGALNDRFHEAFPQDYPERFGFDLDVLPWREQLTSSARPTLLMLLGAVGMVLLIACANVANLTLTRLVKREREFAVRAALGAGKGQLRKQLLTETLLLSLAGAGFGLVVAKGSLDLLVSYTSRFTLRTGEIGLDMSVLGFTLLVAVGAAVLFAFGPGLPFSKDLGSSLTSAGSGRASGGVARRRAQKLLVVSQLTVSFVLLIGAGLLVRSLVNLTRVDPGFDLENVVTMDAIDFSGGRINNAREWNRQVFTEIRRQLKGYPGVRSVAVANAVPFKTQSPRPATIRVEGRQEDGIQSPAAAFISISPDYFETIGTRLLRGRDFTMSDDTLSANVAILNATMAEAYFGDDNPLGRRIAFLGNQGNWGEWHTIVGIAADTKSFGLNGSDVGVVYRPADQNFWGSTIAIRTIGDPMLLVENAREIIRQIDPNRPVENFATLGDLRSEDIAPWRLNTTLFSTFALLALVIAAVGIAGVLAFNVSQRTNEFGIRMSLGADRSNVLMMVLNEGTKMAAIGVVTGGVVAYGLTRLMTGLLFEVEPVDPATFAGVAVLLLGVAGVGSFLPARKATLVNPIDALKSE